jgi:peroxiredoxin
VCVAVGLTAALVAGCGGGDGGSAALGGGLLKKEQTTPKISGTTLDGKSLDVNALKGKVVVLNFYASWCPPCRAETPMLETISKQTASKGVDFVGVLSNDTATGGRAFRARYDVTYPSLVNEDGTWAAKFKGVNALPFTFVIARDGKIAARWVGGITTAGAAAQFTQVLDQLAAEPA